MTPYHQIRSRSEALALWAGALEEQQREIHRTLRGGLPDPMRAADLKMMLDVARIRLESLPATPLLH